MKIFLYYIKTNQFKNGFKLDFLLILSYVEECDLYILKYKVDSTSREGE